MDNNKNLDLLLSKKRSISMAEFHKVINDEQVSSVATIESDKSFHLCYEVKLLNNEIYRIYVKMPLAQIFKLMRSKKI